MLEMPPCAGYNFVLSLCESPRDFDALYYRTPIAALYGFAQMRSDEYNAYPKT